MLAWLRRDKETVIGLTPAARATSDCEGRLGSESGNINKIGFTEQFVVYRPRRGTKQFLNMLCVKEETLGRARNLALQILATKAACPNL
jgi:hypothetical protein